MEDKEKLTTLFLSITPSFKHDIKVYAAECGTSVSDLVRQLLLNDMIKSGFYEENK